MIAAQPHALALHRMSAAILPEPSRFPQLGPVHTVAKRVHPPGRVDYSVSTHIHESKKILQKKIQSQSAFFPQHQALSSLYQPWSLSSSYSLNVGLLGGH